jgi:hypothetical protein
LGVSIKEIIFMIFFSGGDGWTFLFSIGGVGGGLK